MNVIDLAIKGAGGQASLARRIGVTPQQVYEWRKGDRPVPLERCPSIEIASGVRCDDLRPDVEWLRDADGQVIKYAVRVTAQVAA